MPGPEQSGPQTPGAAPAGARGAGAARLAWYRAVVGDGRHNAVTDLARWRGHVYLCHRAGENHWNHPPGALRVLRSADLEAWEPCGAIDTPLDDRDPKLVPDGDRLWLFFASARLEYGPDGAPVEGGAKQIESYASWTEDGVTWAQPVTTFAPRWWLWRPARLADGFWCAAYGAGGVHLLRSQDGLAWRRVAELLPPGGRLRRARGALNPPPAPRAGAGGWGRPAGPPILGTARARAAAPRPPTPRSA